MSHTLRVLALLHDAARCLALAEQGKLTVRTNGRYTRAAITIMQAHCHAANACRPADDEQPPRPVFLLSTLVGAGLLIMRDGTAQTTAAAADWLTLSPQHQIGRLQSAWLNQSSSAWSWLGPRKRGGPRDVHWRATVRRTLNRVGQCPAMVWTAIDALVDTLAREAMTALADSRQARLPAYRHGMSARTRRVLAFLLSDVLPALGMVEVERGDGVDEAREGRFRRLPGWRPPGANPPPTADAALDALLEAEGVEPLPVGPVAEVDPPGRLAVVAVPQADRVGAAASAVEGLDVTLPLDAPTLCTYELHLAARLVALGPPTRYRLDEETLRGALDHGYTPSDALRLLVRYGPSPLPDEVMAWFEARQRARRVARLEPGYRLGLGDGLLLDELLGSRRLGRLLDRGPSGRDAWVPGRHAASVRRSLVRRGFDLHIDAADAPAPLPQPWPSQRAALPAVPLLAALGSYRLLQRALPALAELDLAPLEAFLRVGLTPQQEIAVRRLLASHREIVIDAISEGPRHGGAPEGAAPPHRPPEDDDALLARLQAAIAANAALILVYINAQGQVTRRVIRPTRTSRTGARRYLWATTGPTLPERCFRLDRVVRLIESESAKRTALTPRRGCVRR